MSVIDPRFKRPYVLTPYWASIQFDQTLPEWYNHRTVHGSPYNFFCLTSRLQFAAGAGIEILFYSYEYLDKMKYILELNDGTKLIDYNKADVVRYQRLVEQILTEYPNHCCLFDVRQPFIHRRYINRTWIVTVLPYLIDTIDIRYEPVYEGGQILVDLTHIDQDLDYQMVYESLQTEMFERLSDLYQRGVIVADKRYNNQIIEKFKMKPLYPTDDPQLYVTTLSVDNTKNKTEIIFND